MSSAMLVARRPTVAAYAPQHDAGAGRLPPAPPRRRATVSTAAAALKKQFATFEEMVSSTSGLAVVDMYATWCG